MTVPPDVPSLNPKKDTDVLREKPSSNSGKTTDMHTAVTAVLLSHSRTRLSLSKSLLIHH